MKIGIDVSQTAYENTGVANYLISLLSNLMRADDKNEYILFFSSLRKKPPKTIDKLCIEHQNVKLKTFRVPPTILELLWNKLHLLPIEFFIGDIDVFITSDWTEPPVKNAKKATIIYDLIINKFPDQTHSKTEFNKNNFSPKPNIVSIQKRKLKWVKKESSAIFCISQSSASDISELLSI